MSEFIDRLGKAGYAEAMLRAGERPAWALEDGLLHEDWRRYIRAILTEMREAVTDEMVLAGALAGEMYGNTDAAATFRAMIDTALKEGQ